MVATLRVHMVATLRVNTKALPAHAAPPSVHTVALGHRAAAFWTQAAAPYIHVGALNVHSTLTP
eukprot:1918535-Pyramimonas_sp.AAC.1